MLGKQEEDENDDPRRYREGGHVWRILFLLLTTLALPEWYQELRPSFMEVKGVISKSNWRNNCTTSRNWVERIFRSGNDIKPSLNRFDIGRWGNFNLVIFCLRSPSVQCAVSSKWYDARIFKLKTVSQGDIDGHTGEGSRDHIIRYGWFCSFVLLCHTLTLYESLNIKS